MTSRDYYKVSYRSRNTSDRDSYDHLDNDTEFNANHFKLYDDFTTDLRLNYSMRTSLFQGLERDEGTRRRVADPNDSGVDMENGNQTDDAVASNNSDLLENEVMVDTWSSMDSSNSPLTDSGPLASEDCTPSTSSEPPRDPLEISPTSPRASQRPLPDPGKLEASKPVAKPDKARSRDLTLHLDTDHDPAKPRRPHFLDEDYQAPSTSNIECRIPKPHFLDHTPSPDELDERSDITNPNFLDDDILDGDDKRVGALPKRPPKTPAPDERPKTAYRSTLHYGLESAARSSERDKRASQLYRGTWPGERDVWTGHDSASVRSFSSNGSTDQTRGSSTLENKMECVYSLLSLLTLSPDNNADLSGPLLEMSRSVESCIAMRQAGCIPLLVQLIHSKLPMDTRDRAAKALRNIIHTQTDDKAGRREARVWRLLEQVREYCYTLEVLVQARKDDKAAPEDDTSKHPTQSVAALMKLSFDEEHRHVVCQLGGLQALAALVSGDQAAHGSRTDDNTCLTMRKYAGMTLTNLTFGDGNNKSLLCSFKDFMMALVEQLESPNDDMRQVTAAVLRNLSWRADTNSKQVLREVGAVKGLTEAAMTCQKEATLKSVLSALWNLTAHCSMNKVALCSVDGALGFLVDMLSYNSPTKTLAIVENAGGIMRNVSSHIAIREDYRQILRARNCLSVLLQHLKSPSLTVVSNSCGTLWNLSARCPLDQQFLWDNGAVPMLRSLIHSKHKMIAMGSSAALKNLLNSKPGKNHILSLDTTARSMNLPALPTLGVRKQKALEQELDQNLAETCENIEPATSPSTSNREEKNLFTATERQLAINLERHRMTSSSPLMGNLSSQISLSHSAHLASYFSCSNSLLKGAVVSTAGGSSNNVNRSDSKDSVTSAQSDSVFEKVLRTGKVPVPTPRNKDLVKLDTGNEGFKAPNVPKDGPFMRFPTQPPIPPPRCTTEMRTNYTESGYDVDQDSCDQPIDFSRKYSETKTTEPLPVPPLVEPKPKATKKGKKDGQNTFGDYQETDLDQPTDYSLRYAEHQSETGSDTSEAPGPSIHEDTIQHFATEGTPYETPIIFSTATSMSDLRLIGKDGKPKVAPSSKLNPEVMAQSDEKDTCSIEDTRPDNDKAMPAAASKPKPEKSGQFDTKFSSGMASPEKPISYCDEGTPGYFSRVSSLSSLGEPTEEDCLAKKNAMATINVVCPSLLELSTNSVKDKDGSKAVTFATEPVDASPAATPLASGAATPGFVEDTPLMFSRSSSLGSLPDCDQPDDQRSLLSEVSRLTSGCISPSEIPDSPGASAPLSPRPPAADQGSEVASLPPPDEPRSVFEERATTFLVENTPAHFSTATSLSDLTIDDDPKGGCERRAEGRPLQEERNTGGSSDRTELDLTAQRERRRIQGLDDTPDKKEVFKGTRTPGADTCRVYFTEDTPAILSKAGSNSNLSVLSIGSTPAAILEESRDEPARGDTSDSSNLSDAADLLEECIQKGIAKVVKNKGPSSEAGSANQFAPRDGPYRSLPPYLRSSTETVKMSHEFARNARDSRSASPSPAGSPPPPLPPKTAAAPAPPRPPPFDDRGEGRKFGSRLPMKTQQANKPRPPAATNLARNDSLSSLSLDSFGSTDREIFEKAVNAGLSSVNPKAQHAAEASKGKAHSVERPAEPPRHGRHHKSLDRSDKIAQQRSKLNNPEFERNLAAGAYNVRANKKRVDEFTMTRSPYSYHGDTLNSSLAHQSRRGHYRHLEDGPPSLPARINEPRLDRSHSLSSISNDSFGSTDREVFERCVRMGMSKAQPKKRDDGKRVRSEDRLDVRESLRSRQRRSDALTKSTEEAKPMFRPHELQSLSLTRSPYSLHNDAAHNHRARPYRYHDDGPPSLPARIDAPQRLERRNSLSSLSNDSFGSTDREVFERCVRVGMTRNQPKTKDESKMRVRSDDRLETREPYRSRRHGPSKDRKEDYKLGLLEERPQNVQSKNVPAPFATSALADGNAGPARPTPPRNGCDRSTPDPDTTGDSVDLFNDSNELPTVDSGDTTFESTEMNMDRSNEHLAPTSVDTTMESETKDELNRSNESYADVLDGEWSDCGSPPKNYDVATLTRGSKSKPEWADIKHTDRPQDFDDASKRSTDTWNDNTVPDDVTFPTISGSVHMVSSIKSEVADPGSALPDLLEKSGLGSTFSRPDLTNKLERRSPESSTANVLMIDRVHFDRDRLLDNIPEPSFTSLVDDGEHKFDSILATAIEKEAARLAAQLKSAQYDLVNSVTSLNSLDLDNVKPPSRLGSLLSLTASAHFDETSAQLSKKSSQKSRKKSLPVAMMVKRALSNSQHHGSSEHLDSNPMSFLDNVKPPSEMEHLDMENSMVSVSSIVSEVVDLRAKTPIVFDFKQPIQDFPMCSNLTTVFHDLDQVNPPSLFDEMAESTIEIEQTTAHQVYEDCVSTTLNIVTDIPSGSENCTPLPSDISSVESTPKRHRNPKYLTPKEKRQVAKDRYQTYTINDTDTPTENETIPEADSETYLTWTKSESDSRSDEYVTATSESKTKRRMSAKQRRMEDRARYQTQTVDIHAIMPQEKPSPEKITDPMTERVRERMAFKHTIKLTRLGDSEDIPTSLPLPSEEVDPKVERLEERLAAKNTMTRNRMGDSEDFPTSPPSEDADSRNEYVRKRRAFKLMVQLTRLGDYQDFVNFPTSPPSEDVDPNIERLEERLAARNTMKRNRTGNDEDLPTSTLSEDVDPEIERRNERLAAKNTMKRNRLGDDERYRTRTLSEDVPPSTSFITRDANFENIETTTGYDSLSSNELSHQQIIDERQNDGVFLSLSPFSRDVDSGNNEDDFELNSTQMQTYTKSFRNYLPVTESPSTVDMIVVKNLKNIEMTESYRRALQSDFKNNPSSSDFASYEGDSNSEDKAQSDSEHETPPCKPKPKITKPQLRRDESLESNESNEQESEPPKAIRGRKKALYVSPYRRNTATPKKLTAVTPPTQKTIQKVIPKAPANPAKASPYAKPPNTTPGTSKATSANTSPKKMPPKSPSKIAQKPISVPLAAIKPLPLERQGTFTKEESPVAPKDSPTPKGVISRVVKAGTSIKPAANTSPSRLPQMNRYARPQLRKASSNESKQPLKKTPTRSSAPALRSSASNHSLQSNESGKTVTLASRSSRQGSSSSVNSVASTKTKDIESKIAGLWKKVEQTKKQPAKPDKRVWIETDKTETPKLIRSSTFEGQPKHQVAAPKQKTTIGIRVSQIPSLRPKSTPTQSTTQIPSTSRKQTTKVFVRKQMNGQAQ